MVTVLSEKHDRFLMDTLKILLADEDSLRRDGLASVIQANKEFEIVSQCQDGETALARIRELQPQIAILDLNLPGLHGIELIRRVRGENLGCKIVILAGTADDDIVREVVRAGGDAYVLKNGPARHLLDAISYVRDGGQYFSPQLRRDGRDRHLLEEPPRIPAVAPRVGPSSVSQQQPADARFSRRRGPARLRERLRQDASAPRFEERDYEILDMMAEGIRPILDRLDEIEDRIGQMETGETAVPGNIRGWLDSEMADTFGGSPGLARDPGATRSLAEIEARLPRLIEQAVDRRVESMAGRLQQEIEETHLRTLETFVKNIQVKLVQRVNALETDMSRHADAMRQLRESSERTEDNLSRLISGVDRLAQDLPRRLPAPESPPPPVGSAESPAEFEAVPVQTPAARRQLRSQRKRRWLSSKQKVILFWAFAAALITIAISVRASRSRSRNAAPEAPAVLSKSAADARSTTAEKLPPDADLKTRFQAAEQYTQEKNYSLAEQAYKEILRATPNNVDALKGLASVLYREDKIEESAAVLDRLPKTN